MSFSQDFEAARKKRFEEKEEELRLRASLKEKSIEQQMLDKAQSEQMRKKADKDATVQAEIDAFRAEKKKTFSERFGDAMASKNADLFREYIDSARSDHLDDITRTGILEGTLPYEDVAKIYKDSIGDWNPQIKSEDDFELYDITRDFGYNADTNELEWYVNKVTGDDEEDFRRSVSYEQLHSEVGQGNISEYASLWNKDYKTPDVVEIEMPDGSINRISNDAWLKEYPDHKIPEMKAVIDAKKNDEGRLVNKSLYISDYNAEGWGKVEDRKVLEGGLVESEGGNIADTSIEKIYSKDSVADGSARKDYEKTLRDFGGYNDEEIERKLQAFDIHSMYDANVTMSNKYGWLPGAVNSFKYGMN